MKDSLGSRQGDKVIIYLAKLVFIIIIIRKEGKYLINSCFMSAALK